LSDLQDESKGVCIDPLIHFDLVIGLSVVRIIH